jgi:hypothetical protein
MKCLVDTEIEKLVRLVDLVGELGSGVIIEVALML